MDSHHSGFWQLVWPTLKAALPADLPNDQDPDLIMQQLQHTTGELTKLMLQPGGLAAWGILADPLHSDRVTTAASISYLAAFKAVRERCGWVLEGAEVAARLRL